MQPLGCFYLYSQPASSTERAGEHHCRIDRTWSDLAHKRRERLPESRCRHPSSQQTQPASLDWEKWGGQEGPDCVVSRASSDSFEG